jgi:N-acetyl-anhydromuramyl-L-alanine amidase AmpD
MKTLYGATLHLIPRIDHGPRHAHVQNIVVHDMEADNIDAVQHYFETTSPDAVGAHIGIGANGDVRQWADLDALVYHAKGDNTSGIGIELAGYAKQSRAKWISRRRQRVALAKALARLCHRYNLGIPTHTGKANIKGHVDIPAGGHTDPGPNFPWDAVMKLARKYYREWYM